MLFSCLLRSVSRGRKSRRRRERERFCEEESSEWLWLGVTVEKGWPDWRDTTARALFPWPLKSPLPLLLLPPPFVPLCRARFPQKNQRRDNLARRDSHRGKDDWCALAPFISFGQPGGKKSTSPDRPWASEESKRKCRLLWTSFCRLIHRGDKWRRITAPHQMT